MDDGFNNIEDLLKETLDGYRKQPSPKVWKAVSLRLFFGSKIFYTSVLLLLIAGGITTYLLLKNDDVNNVVINESGNTELNISTDKPGSEMSLNGRLKTENSGSNFKVRNDNDIEAVSEKTATEYDTKPDYINKMNGVKTGIKNNEKEVYNGAGVVAGSSVAVANGLSQQAGDVDVRPAQKKQTVYPGLIRLEDINSMPVMQPRDPMFGNDAGFGFGDRIDIKGLNRGVGPVSPPADYGKIKGAFGVAASITPEIIFLNDENNTTKRAVNFDITGVYGDEFFAEAGLGVALSEDDGKFSINYSQYDSVGYFYQVNSFEIDPVTGEPVFKTTLEGLYDTVDYQTYEKTNNRYTYLRIPVYVGYKIRNFKNLSLYLKAGGVYSILVNSYEPGVDYKNENAMTIDIEDETPGRIHSYFKLSASVGLSYSVSNTVDFSVEPVYNYYMQPVYERRINEKSPWSLGVRFGILIKLK